MTDLSKLSSIRREYGDLSLNDEKLPNSPVIQFKRWFSDVLNTEINDPTAMLLSTVDDQGHPDSRVVLLKDFKGGTFVFYTNYQSTKAKQIHKNPYVALNFYWPGLVRQVRIRGRIKAVSDDQSNAYFATRPRSSQLSAIASPQSRVISCRSELESRLNELTENHQEQLITRPEYWGGYIVTPDEYEFWQGRDNRFHDRIHYYREAEKWRHRRLAP